MKYAPKSAPESAPESAPRRAKMSAIIERGEHGFYYIRGLPYTFTKRSDGVYCIYAPGCPEDGIEFAKPT